MQHPATCLRRPTAGPSTPSRKLRLIPRAVIQTLARSLGSEDRLRDHAVDALGAVDRLGDVVIDRNARDHVCLLAAKLRKPPGDEGDCLADGDFHGLFEVGVEAHHDPVRGGLCAGPGDLHVFAHDQLEPSTQARLNCATIDLALTLDSVAVTDREERARGMDRHVEGRPGR